MPGPTAYAGGMFKPRPDVVEALREMLPVVDADGTLTQHLEAELDSKRPDLTDVLLAVASRAVAGQLDLGRILTAATCRAGCALLGRRHPGAIIEVRVPPFAAVQVGFGTGPRHTRGTPPNVVEASPATFIALATGHLGWAEADVRASGTHAHEAAAAFPLTRP